MELLGVCDKFAILRQEFEAHLREEEEDILYPMAIQQLPQQVYREMIPSSD